MILITGIPRSRTSLTAAIFEKCGAEFGKNLKKPNEHNPLGYYEDMAIIKGLVNPHWEKMGFHPLDRTNMPTKEDVIIDPEWKKKTQRIMGKLKHKTAIKEPKMCLYWEQWHDAFPEAKWVIVRRPRAEVLESIRNRTPWMRGTFSRQNRAAHIQLYIDHHLRRIDELKAEGAYFEIHTENFLACDWSEIQKCVEWCGLKWNEQAKELVNPKYTYIRS